MVVISVPGSTRKRSVYPCALIGLEFQLELGSYDIVACGLQLPGNQREFECGTFYTDSDSDVRVATRGMVSRYLRASSQPTARTSTP